MPELKAILEAVLLAAAEPLPLERLLAVFPEAERPEREKLCAALAELAAACEGRGLELVEVAGGFRLQVPPAFAPWVSRLWEERTAHYSRALLETLALIAYRQPITRGEIEAVRGVSLSGSIMKTLQERDWIKVVGHREVPGRPALYATSYAFLDYFNLKSLSELPALAAGRDPDAIGAALERRALAPPNDSLPSAEPSDV
ncbi:MAG: SMC-Scp complex subunit ScpB [Candidatus Competibacteraceae bacterium]|nr:SMC-Scp complex subunit ScpB [Candidatus Competibacteraceae bacterium]MBK7984279.1 SMC-Scp complex subunit ScpB [Candidatus Competibacteraceae bacterium]MBK8896246.1 SMC-Scp complex subunit ScpB [Candidatus Competibacteraceae bacterium]MBK8964944.1 SMC-Scp complex subunit ScpB [Candidatus Competibacteraceae bacterium]MBK9950226.1 SMC-Scp complex subunit ScpB [Candidatus Competibacteraceae bacterium]